MTPGLHPPEAIGLPWAVLQDQHDPLRHFRSQFHLPAGPGGKPVHYFSGNSLGLQPLGAAAAVNEVLQDWARLGVEGHFAARNPWMPYHECVTHSLARLMGAQPGEVVAANSLTVNLHLLMASFYRPDHKRPGIVLDVPVFPSDRHALASQLQWHGFDPQTWLFEVGPPPGRDDLPTETLLARLDELRDRAGLLLLAGVNYATGQAYELHRIVPEARHMGYTVGLDLAHAAGNIPLQLHEWGVDFAVWCGYKYLNAGPGSGAGLFVHERHAHWTGPRLAGWWGHNAQSRFAMGAAFDATHGAEGWQLSNPPILPLACLRAALDVFDQTDLPSLRAKSLQLTGYLEHLLHLRLGPRVRILTPADPQQRGCQLSLLLPGQEAHIIESLAQRGIVADWRQPNILRVAPVPLYNSFEDVWHLVEALNDLTA